MPDEPALWEPVTRTLVLADLHYGHEVELLRGGVWVPSKAAERTERVVELLEQTGAERLVLNGDLKHLVPRGHRRERWELEGLLAAVVRAGVALEVVAGNHDGNLAWQLPPKAILHPAEGFVIGGGGGTPVHGGRGRLEVVPHQPLKQEGGSDDDYLKDNNHREHRAHREKIESNSMFSVNSVVQNPNVGGGLGVCHGHAWPSAEVMAQPVVAIGHNHPMVELPAGLAGESHQLPCWVRAVFNARARERYPEAHGELWVMPAFVEKAGRPVNRPDSTGMGPLLANGFIDWDSAEVTTLEGVELGTIGELRAALIEADGGEG